MNNTEKQKNGEWYNPNDIEIKNLQKISRNFNKQFNLEGSSEKRFEIMKKWFNKVGENCYIEPNFFCDFGCHLILGDNIYFNTNCVVLDSAMVEIGSNTMIGSNVQLCTPTHPINPEKRLQKENEKAKPIKIGKNCWIGSSATILGGVTIGDNSVIGAGCTITKDIPNNTLVKQSANNITLEEIKD